MISSNSALRRTGAAAVPPEGLLLVGMVSVQVGSACASEVFGRAGPGGTALLRLAFTALVLCVATRPSLRRRTRSELGVVITYGLNMALMNWTFYEALHRLPLGVAVTIEFTGPLAVAIAGSRRVADGVFALLAAAGVVLLAVHAGAGGVHVLGVLLALAAGACWATYILLAKRLGTTSFRAPEALAVGTAVGTLLVLPAGLLEGGSALGRPGVLGACLGVAVLSSLVPYTLELTALRRLSTAAFGLLMSLEPVVAALAGVVVLGQRLGLVEVLAIVLVIGASIGSTLVSRRSAVTEPHA